MDFNQFLTLFQPDEEFRSRLGAAQRLWDQSSPAKQSAIIAWLKQHGRYKGRNPYFFILDFQTKRRETLTFAQYYAKYGTTEEQGGWKMENPTGQQVIYVKTKISNDK